MAADDRFFRELERNNKRKVETNRTDFVNDAENTRNTNAAKPEDFRGTGIVPDSQIAKDIRTTSRLESKFGKPGFVASALELVVNTGISTGEFFSPSSDDETIESIDTSKFDDYINRVDTAATIHRPEGDLTFAIDLYSGDDPTKALEKIAKSSNEATSETFAGFTEIRYYQDENGKKRLFNVPRYTIGVDKKSVFAAVDDVANTGNLFQTTSMAIVKFKMLYEMSQQNALYESYLYEYQDDFESRAESDTEYQKALESIEQLDTIYLRELEDAKKLLGPEYRDLTIDQVAKIFKKQDSTFRAILEATQKLADDKAEQDEEKEEKPEEEKTREDAIKARNGGQRILAALRRLTTPKAA